jgi:hypothetical protein
MLSSVYRKNSGVTRTMLDVFLVSVIYWIAILAMFLWLSHRIGRLTKRITELEKGRDEHNREPLRK